MVIQTITMLTIQLNSSVPITDQIAAGLRRAIASGVVEAGAPLPTVRQLAGDLGVNLNTVARAYRALEAQGLCETRGRRGTQVIATRMIASVAKQASADLDQRLSSIAADATLAGVTRAQLAKLFTSQLDTFLPAS